MARRWVVTPWAVAMALLVGATSAHAATVSVDGSLLRFEAAPAEANQLQVVRDGSDLVVRDPGAPLTAGAGCASANGREARCAAGSISRLDADLGDFADGALIGTDLPSILDGGDGDDFLLGGNAATTFIGGAGLDTALFADHTTPVSVTPDGRADDGSRDEGDDVQPSIERIDGGRRADNLSAGDAPRALYGGGGDDRLTGSPGDDVALHGGDGNDSIDGTGGGDTLYGEAGADVLAGGAGDDALVGGNATDELGGGPGSDTASYADHQLPVRASLDAAPNDGQPGENDLIAADVENLDGSAQNDILIGDERPNHIDGRAGSDSINGGAGDDVLVGEQVRDRLSGGDGNDSLDLRSIFESGESGFLGVVPARGIAGCGAGRDAVTGDGADRVASDCEIVDRGIWVRRKVLRPSRSGVVAVPVVCGRPRACTFGVRLRFAIGTKSYRTKGSGRIGLKAGSRATVRVRLNARAVKALRGRKRASGETVVDADIGLLSPLTLLRPRG